MPWLAWIWLIAFSRSRSRAAASKSSASDAAVISLTSRSCTARLLPCRKSSVSAHQLAIGRSHPRRPTQGALQRLIWNSRQGRVRAANTESEQERSRKARCRVLRVRVTAPALAKGPK